MSKFAISFALSTFPLYIYFFLFSLEGILTESAYKKVERSRGGGDRVLRDYPLLTAERPIILQNLIDEQILHSLTF